MIKYAILSIINYYFLLTFLDKFKKIWFGVNLQT